MHIITTHRADGQRLQCGRPSQQRCTGAAIADGAELGSSWDTPDLSESLMLSAVGRRRCSLVRPAAALSDVLSPLPAGAFPAAAPLPRRTGEGSFMGLMAGAAEDFWPLSALPTVAAAA